MNYGRENKEKREMRYRERDGYGSYITQLKIISNTYFKINYYKI